MEDAGTHCTPGPEEDGVHNVSQPFLSRVEQDRDAGFGSATVQSYKEMAVRETRKLQIDRNGRKSRALRAIEGEIIAQSKGELGPVEREAPWLGLRWKPEE